MPNISKRKEAIWDLLFLSALSRINEIQVAIYQTMGLLDIPQHLSVEQSHNQLKVDLFSLGNDEADIYEETVLNIMNSRYLHQGFNLQKRTLSFDINTYCAISKQDFKQVAQTSKERFHHIYLSIQDHDVFRNKSSHKQLPIACQLACRH
ncbi:hypothetical protein O181_004433 [Austropuccinia psidii MF-1]|uniref:Uncharacterized protein n=1 Tax=Austropuccinia psidii MF-1 TaxID=1389203 RepID=A0A9Q3BGB9_9BASI|nr:hypothetical protein [Austropuccinia psidii MF-1]